MKKHYVYIAIIIVATIMTIALPQLTGTAFVENRDSMQAKDWLSAQLIKFYKKPQEHRYTIPDHIQTILIQSGQTRNSSSSYIEINGDTTRRITYYKHAIFTIAGDTLKITNNNGLMSSLSIYVDRTLHNLVLDNVAEALVDINHKFPINLSVRNNSDITIVGKRNTQLYQMTVKDQSTLSVSHCFTSKVNINAENSMVYIDPQNAIDSLNVHLTGKSNIKVKGPSRYILNNFDKLMKEFKIESPHFQIYATGDTQYYDRMKK